MDEQLGRDAERYRQLESASSDYYGHKGLASYGLIAGLLLCASGLFFPSYSDGEHPMLLLGVGLCVAIAAGSYLLIQRDAERTRAREIKSIEDRFARLNMRVRSDGGIDHV